MTDSVLLGVYLMNTSQCLCLAGFPEWEEFLAFMAKYVCTRTDSVLSNTGIAIRSERIL